MDNQSTYYYNRWRRRVLDNRKHYFFQEIKRAGGVRSISLFQFLAFMKKDLVYFYKWTVIVVKQLKGYGPLIKRNYNISLTQQFFRLIYVVFILRIHPKNFRSRQLFKSENWNQVKDFDYNQHRTQIDLSKLSYPDEIHTLENKFAFYKYCSSINLDTPKVLAVFEKGTCIYPDNNLEELPGKNLFIKDEYGGQGVNTRKLVFSGTTFTDSKGNEFLSSEIMKYLADYSFKKRVMIQEIIENHSSWKVFTPRGACHMQNCDGKVTG